MKEVLKEVLAGIKPSKEEEKKVMSIVSDFLKKLNSSLKDAKAILGGSGEKGTWLRGTFDVDVFVLFDYKKFKDRSAEISDIIEPILKKTFGKLDRLHGSRDYFQIKQGEYTFEVVPIIEIKKADDAVNITDISPLHAKWVLKNKKYQDDIRLLKQFCRAKRVYGAESYIKGFSGYICEILTVYAGGFEKLIKQAPKWKAGDVIDVEKYFRNRNEVYKELNRSKLNSPIIIIDPVQKTRNAAAALSKEKLELFQQACRDLIKSPGKDQFTVKKLTVEELKKKAGKNKLVTLEVSPLEGKDDVVGGKLMKAFEYMANQAKEYGFNIIDKGWEWDDKALFWFITDKDLEKEVKWEGPPVKIKPFVEQFKKKHKNTFIENNRVYAMVKREFTRLEDFMKDMAKSPYVKERTKRIEAR